MSIIDQAESSATFACDVCDLGLIDVPAFDLQVELPAFKQRRGDRDDQRSLSDHSFARRLIDACQDNRSPSPAILLDFGLATPAHFTAMQRAVARGVSAYELDRVLGSGTAITALIRGVLGDDAPRFVTLYDRDCERNVLQRKAESRSPAHRLIPAELETALPPLYATEHVEDPVAQLKWFTPDSNWTWYVVEYDQTSQVAFGLVSGHELELGYFSVRELEEAGGPWGLRVERDLSFEPTSLSELRQQHRHDFDIERER